MALRAISDVPSNEVGAVVQEFVDNGVKTLKVEEQDDGLFKIIPIKK